jgi:hypothetical protein
VPAPAAHSINTLLCYLVHWQAVTCCAVIHLVAQVVGGQVGGKLPGDGSKGRPVGWQSQLMLSLRLGLGGEAWEAPEGRRPRCCCCSSLISLRLQLGVVKTKGSTVPLVTCGGSCTGPIPAPHSSTTGYILSGRVWAAVDTLKRVIVRRGPG